MVRNQGFSLNGVSHDGKKAWDPLKTLEIINSDPGYQCITCIDYVSSQRRRCRNPIRADNRRSIMEMLNEIAYLPPQSHDVASRLRAIASLALCPAFHQNQIDTVINRWQEIIKRAKPEVGKHTFTKPGRKTNINDFSPEEGLEDIREQLREARELIASLMEERMREQRPNQGHERHERNRTKDKQEEDTRRKEREERNRAEQARKQEEQEEEERKKKQQEKEREEDEQRKSQEREAHKEHIRQKAQKVREEREREKEKRAQQEREEWDRSWARYRDQWILFRSSPPQEGNIRDSIPWPVKSGLYRDVQCSAVEEFMKSAVPRDANVAKLMRKECWKWHPDRVKRWLRGAVHTEVEQRMADICRVVTDIIDSLAGRSSDFIG